MSLTPSSDDPARKAELARKKQNPEAFGTSVPVADIKHRDHPDNGGLKVAATDDAPALPDEVAATDDAPALPDEAAQQWLEFLDDTVDSIVAQLENLDEAQLAALREHEVAGKNRKTLLDAVDEELENRE